MTREQAIAEFRWLVAAYGLQWRADVPQQAHERMNAVCAVLKTEQDRREALGW